MNIHAVGQDDRDLSVAPLIESAEPVLDVGDRTHVGAHRLIAGGLIAFCILWIVGATALSWRQLASLTGVEIAQFAAALVLGPTLAGVVWLLALRTSLAEAQRFGATAALMRGEAGSLEQTIRTLTAMLDDTRAGMADQARQIVALGDAANDRLAQVGRGLSEEIDQADVHARALAEAVGGAQTDLAVLLAGMPRATDEVTQLGRQIDALALKAGEHAAALDAQVVALADRGHQAETVAGGAAQKLAAHISRMEATSATAGERLEGVTATMSAAVDEMLDRAARAIDESRKGIAAQGDAMLAMVSANQAALDAAAHETADSLAARIEVIEQVIDRLAARLDGQREVGDALAEELEAGIARVQERLDALQVTGTERNQTLAHSITALGSSADAMNEALRTGDALGERTIATAENLLVALEAAAREIDETLPDALTRLDTRVSASQSVVAAAKPELLSLVTAAESTHDAIEAIAQVIGDQRRVVDTLNSALIEALSTGRVKADAIGQMVEEAVDRANRFAESAAPQLIEQLMRVRDTATAAADHARDTLAKVIPEAADAIEAAGTQAFRDAIERQLPHRLAEVGAMAEGAVASAEKATVRLAAQMTAIEGATSAIDTRIESARAEREAAEQDSFAKRSSLLIEAMNSAAIDIVGQLSNDVSDTAWASYLKGDRGVFTRRAVRLIDGTVQREIADLYDADPGFRDQVNRYIHDFEAMLRQILTQRDGSPLGVTLLSSDMGKLYVALAQAIERLR